MNKLKLIIIIIWMGIIFLFSNQPAVESGNLSNSFINKTIVKVYEIFNGETDSKSREEIINKYSYFVRKGAHFTVYFILGLLCFTYFKDFTKYPIIYSLILCFVYACTDEFHQYFVNGRYCSFIDVLIDSSGTFISLIISRYIFANKHKI